MKAANTNVIISSSYYQVHAICEDGRTTDFVMDSRNSSLAKETAANIFGCKKSQVLATPKLANHKVVIDGSYDSIIDTLKSYGYTIISEE